MAQRVEIEKPPLFYANITSRAKVVVNQGGTSSGKTWNILDVLFVLAIQKPNIVITIAGQDIPNLKKGAYRDAKRIWANSEIYSKCFGKPNESERVFTCINGSILEFNSYSDEQDARSGKRDYLFVNEANGIPYDIYWQLAIRTKYKIFIDYNPTARFWVHEKLLGRDDVELLISDHRHNDYLTPEQHAAIEGIEDPELWKVYARGKTGKLTGLIYTNWELCEELPPVSERRWTATGMDFGFSCFRGDTMITTSQGEKPICAIEKGDLVLTSKGYKRVKQRIYNGRKKIIHKRFIFDERDVDMYCTPEHYFKANGKWKKYGELTRKDNLCVLSNLMGLSINDTQVANIPNIISTNGKATGCIIQNCCIMQFMSSIMGKFRKVVSYTTKTGMRLITMLKTWLRLLHRNTRRYMKTLKTGTSQTPKNTQNDITLPRTGCSAGQKSLNNLQTSAECVNGAVLNTHQQTHTKDFAVKDVIINGNTRQKKTTKKGCANAAESIFSETNILNQNVVPTNAPINLQMPIDIKTIDEEICEVWDLEVEDVHEYFANGILVHNCDPTAIETMCLAHGDLWVDELCYQTGLTNPDICRVLRDAHLTRNDLIIADSAEPKSIAEIRAGGFNVQPCAKGADSILNGIDLLRRYKIHITRRSVGVRGEVLKYKWQVDRDGNTLNKPIGLFDHAMDAIRYVAMARLPMRATGRARAHIITN